LIVSTLILLPPRIFLSIAGVNHVLYCSAVLILLGHGQAPLMEIVTGSCFLALGLLASWFLFVTKRTDFEQQRVIEKQKHELQELMMIAAHDLRSPLYGLRNLLQTLSPASVLSHKPTVEAALAQAQESCNRMLSLVERLLDPNSSRYQPKAIFQTHDLRFIITASVERTNLLAQTKDIGFILNLPSEPARALTDSNFLDQVLDNLIYNAIQYSPPHSTITISLQSCDNRWHAEIQDQGSGISDEDKASLFTQPHPKKCASDAIDENRQSSRGFGLFIVNRLMHELGGKVGYRKAVNGSVFLITLPNAASN
jgi:signal transduction histidine kinase